jgi:hypothetical protein
MKGFDAARHQLVSAAGLCVERAQRVTDHLIFAAPLTLNSAPEEVLRLPVELGGSRSFLSDAAQTRGASTILTRKIGLRTLQSRETAMLIF